MGQPRGTSELSPSRAVDLAPARCKGGLLGPADRQQPTAAGRVLPEASSDGAPACDPQAPRGAPADGSVQHSVIPARAAPGAGEACHSPHAAAGSSLRLGLGEGLVQAQEALRDPADFSLGNGRQDCELGAVAAPGQEAETQVVSVPARQPDQKARRKRSIRLQAREHLPVEGQNRTLREIRPKRLPPGSPPLAVGFAPCFRRQGKTQSRVMRMIVEDLAGGRIVPKGDQQVRPNRIDLGRLQAPAGSTQKPARVDDEEIGIRLMGEPARSFDQRPPAENRIGGADEGEPHAMAILHGDAGRRPDRLLADIRIEQRGATTKRWGRIGQEAAECALARIPGSDHENPCGCMAADVLRRFTPFGRCMRQWISQGSG